MIKKLNGKLSQAIREDCAIAQNYREIIEKIESDTDSKIWTKDALKALLTFNDFNTVTRDLTHYDICMIGSLMVHLAKENNIHLSEKSLGFPSYNNATPIKRKSIFGLEYTYQFENSVRKDVRRIIREEMERMNFNLNLNE